MDNSFIPQIKPLEKDLKPEFQNVQNDPVPTVVGGGTEMSPKKSTLIPNILGRRKISPQQDFSGIKKPVNPKKKKMILSIVAFLVVFVIVNSLMFLNLYIKGKALLASTKSLKAAVSSQDLNNVQKEIGNTKYLFSKFKSSYKLVSWMRIIPFFGSYVSDGSHLLNAGTYGFEIGEVLVETVKPYADLIGFSGGTGAESGEKTAADRIDFIVKAIPDILPKIDEIAAKSELVKKELDNINPERYPVKFAGKEVRASLETALNLVDEGTELVTTGKPLLAQAPELLGLNSTKTYLVIFQNDKELRPTGGFITAYSIMNVDKAKFSPVDSSDIYSLDAKYKPSVEAPQPIIDYLKGPYVLTNNLYLRDMNWSPDFGESMKLFTTEVEKVGIKGVDGIIAVDTQLLVNILNVIGPVGVSGFGNYSTEIVTECNCPQVIYELESFADVEGPIVWDPAGTGKIIYAPANSDNRKKIIGPLMNAILSNAFGQPKEKLPDLVEAGFESLLEKHVLFYLFDEEGQGAVEDFGIAGKIKDYDGDYLHINDANLGGRKSNLYATQEIDQEISVLKDGSVEKTLTITYNNPEKQDGWLNSVLPNWVRIYVPKGSSLISIDGLEDKSDPYEEFGKTVFAGYFELRPQGVSKVVVKYKLPFKVTKEYKLLIQKQPGKDAPLYITRLGKNEQELNLSTDQEIKIKI